MINQHAKMLVAGLGAALALLAAAPATPASSGRAALDLLLTGRYAEFGELLTPEAKGLLTPDFMRERVGGEIKNFGKVVTIGAPSTAESGTSVIVSIPVRFENSTVNVQLTVSQSGQIAGLHFRSPEEHLPEAWKRPDYSKPDQFHEREVTIGADDWKLPGKFTVPNGKGPFPVVVLVHGPGPNDRDESIFSTRIFEDIAEGLASRGIAVLRYDKRTRIYGPQMSEVRFTLQEETVEDAVRAIALARRQPETDPKRVFVAGHSLGGYAIPRIARQDGKLAGAIMLAGLARPIEDVSLAQTEFLLRAKGGASQDEQKRLDLMKAEHDKIKSLSASADNPPVLLGLPTEYFLDLKGYDPPAEARRLGIPLVLLQGERDFQVTSEDLALWKAALSNAKNVAFHTYSSLNDLFIEGQGPSSPVEYRRGGNVAPVVIRDIADWIGEQKP